MKKLIALLFFGCFVLSLQSQSLSYKPGGGVKLADDDDEWALRLLGYIQSTYTLYNENENNATTSEFFVRRARLDFIFDYLKDYQIFFELDARGTRTEMVLAQFDIRYYKTHWIEIGKFITPFSHENLRSSRGLSTVERYSGLNSMFLLPALDTQYGIMFFGSFDQLKYYLSLTNGNGKASQNIKEDNNAKDLQVRLDYNISSELMIGGSFNLSTEREQGLKLADHTFTSFAEAQIKGKRLGFLGHFEFIKDAFLLRGEAFSYNFDEKLSANNQIKGFFGGYAELGYFLFGNFSDGLQLIGRFETARFTKDSHELLLGPTELNTYLIGTNWYRNGVFRLQVNLAYEQANEKSLVAGRFQGKDSALELLTMLQLKF